MVAQKAGLRGANLCFGYNPDFQRPDQRLDGRLQPPCLDRAGDHHLQTLNPEQPALSAGR